jgi:hypothetical protein
MATPKPPPTTECIKVELEEIGEQVTFRVLDWFGFCCFCLGLVIGSIIN